ncbi:MAG: DMT family transporter [Bacteroidales bacterium]|nr:DMT family transporter [Bacteroidales bacterium]
MNKTLIGHLACLTTYIIFAFNIIVCRDIATTDAFPPIVITSIRCIVVAMLFWLLSLVLPKEKVARGDLLPILGASLLGLVIPQWTFLTAIGYTAPVDLSVINSVTPIMTMLVAAVVLKEPITTKKAGGVALSFVGVVFLILQSIHAEARVEHTSPIGILFVLLNSASFALYLGIFRPLIARYRAVTFMKWMFLFAALCSLPLALPQVHGVQWTLVTPRMLSELAYLIVMATFVAYFLIPIGQKNIRPTLVSMYSYTQPIVATIISISIGMDRITWQKVLAACMVVGGVVLVNSSRAAAPAAK